MREWADEETLDRIESALEAPNRLNRATGAPEWWVDEEEAWETFQRAVKAR